MKSFLKIILLIIIVLFIFWGLSLLKCEYLTKKHYEDFKFAYTDNTMIGDIEYFKVLSCDDKYAEVYYVGKDMSCGNVLTFFKDKNKWNYDSWQNTIWSVGGSASEVIWPYWWHFIYGGI